MTKRAFFRASILLTCLACGRLETNVGAEIHSSAPDAAIDATIDVGVDAPPASPYLEAEDGALTGFTVAHDLATSGGAYILPPSTSDARDAPGDATAEYTFHIETAGAYRMWGRIHGPAVSHNSYWVSIDGEAPYIWRLSTGVAWFWSFFTRDTQYGVAVEYHFEAGDHRLVIRNRDPDVGLDRLYVAAPGTEPPGNDTPCNPPHSVELADGGCIPSCGSHGNTTCGTDVCDGQPTLVAYDCSICCHTPPDGGADAHLDGALEADAPLD